MKHFLMVMAVCISATAFSQHRPEIHCKHFFYGYPFGTPATNDLIVRDCYALSNNDDTKFADWVAYCLTMHEVDGDLEVERNWREDPWLAPEETLEDAKDYDGSNSKIGVDRGHQAPLASFQGSRFASQTNLLSNITPQYAALNQGTWKDLEEAVRNVVRTGRTVYVMTGPLYERDMPKLPNADEPHRVPSGYWKVVISIEGKSFQTAAFIMEQETGRTEKVLSKLVTIDEVERRSGLDLLWELPDAQEATVEATKNEAWAKQWFN